jgi:hypothetical protein
MVKATKHTASVATSASKALNPRLTASAVRRSRFSLW